MGLKRRHTTQRAVCITRCTSAGAVSLLSVLLLLLLSCHEGGGSSSSRSSGGRYHTPEVLTSEEILAEPEAYIIVGGENGDVRSIKEAMLLVGPETKVIVLMDTVHTESGIVVDRDIILHGMGAASTVLQAAGSPEEADDRVLQVEEGAAVIIKNITIRHGNAPGPYRSGAGIRNYGRLSLECCDIRDNQGVYGAGIYNAGTLQMRYCTVADNRTLPMTMKEKTDATGCTGSGGGIKNEPDAYLELDSCTISGNTSLRKGGGLFVSCESSAKLTNCTISENESRQSGGGIHVRGDLELVHCTIADNRSLRKGGGIYNLGRLDMIGCLFSENIPVDFTAGSGGGIYGQGELGVQEYNLVADGSLDTYLRGDSGLCPLGDHGGPTRTHALSRRSPAVNVIPHDELKILTDQRGRPRDKAGDLGALER